jgi:hypothetical protein
MSAQDASYWKKLTDVCVMYNDEDGVFEKEDIHRGRRLDMRRLEKIIQARLDGITASGRFRGWLALYQPALPGVRLVQPMVTREHAEPHYEKCEALLAAAVAYVHNQLAWPITWEESPSRKLSYRISHPEGQEKIHVGTALQALLSYQHGFLVDVLPDWYTDHGNVRKHEGLTLGQMLQAGRTADEAAEDWLGKDFGGLGDQGYDLGIDPEFE